MDAQTNPPNAVGTVRIDADACVFDSPQNADTRAPITLRPHNDVLIKTTLLNRKRVIDASNISAVKLEIFDIGDPNAPEPRTELLLISKELPAAEINTALDEQGRSYGLCHAEFALNATDTAVECGAKWLKISARTTDDTRTTFAQGWVQIDRSVGESPSAAEGREIFLKASGNLSEVESPQTARTNIGAMSAEETDAKISEALEGFSPQTESLRPLYLEAVRNGGVLFKKSKAYAQNSESVFDTLPLSICFTYYCESFEGVGTAATGLSFFNKLHKPTSKYISGFRISYEIVSGIGKMSAEIGNPISPPERATKTDFSLEAFGGTLPLGRHSVVCIIGAQISGGFAQIRMFIDGTELPVSAQSGRGIENANLGSDTALQLCTAQLPAVADVITAPVQITLGRIKIFNFDISAPYGNYGADKYALGMDEPIALRKKRLVFKSGVKEFDDIQWTPNLYAGTSMTSATSGLRGTTTNDVAGLSCTATIPSKLLSGETVEIASGGILFEGGAVGIVKIKFYGEYMELAAEAIIPTASERNFITLSHDAASINISFEPNGGIMTIGQAFTIQGFAVKNLCVCMSLDDSPNGIVLRDNSGNAMNAAITGTYEADKTETEFSSVGSISWNAETSAKNLFSPNASVPENCVLEIYALADSDVSASFGNEAAADFYSQTKALAAGQWTKIADGIFNNANKLISATPAQIFTGTIRVSVFGKRLSQS